MKSNMMTELQTKGKRQETCRASQELKATAITSHSGAGRGFGGGHTESDNESQQLLLVDLLYSLLKSQ